MRTTPRLATCAALALTVSACAGTAGTSPADDAATSDADASTDDAVASAHRERCNGFDDDGDGRVDEGCPIRLTTDPADDRYPALDGHRVAWNRGADIWVRDLPDGPERLVLRNAYYPALSGERLAARRDDGYVVMDLRTGAAVVIPPMDGAGGQFTAPALSGARLAWSQLQAGTEEDYDVYVRDLESNTTVHLGADPAIQEYPLIEGTTVAWQDDRTGHHTIGLLHLFDVFAADVRTPTALSNVTQRAGDQYFAAPGALDQRRVLVTEYIGPVLQYRDPQPCRPVLYDLATGARRELELLALDCGRARSLSGPRAIVEQDPQGASDLWLVDVSTGQHRRITQHPRRPRRPVRGDLLVWQDDRNDTWDLYMMDLTDAERGDLSPEGITP